MCITWGRRVLLFFAMVVVAVRAAGGVTGSFEPPREIPTGLLQGEEMFTLNPFTNLTTLALVRTPGDYLHVFDLPSLRGYWNTVLKDAQGSTDLLDPINRLVPNWIGQYVAVSDKKGATVFTKTTKQWDTALLFSLDDKNFSALHSANGDSFKLIEEMIKLGKYPIAESYLDVLLTSSLSENNQAQAYYYKGFVALKDAKNQPSYGRKVQENFEKAFKNKNFADSKEGLRSQYVLAKLFYFGEGGLQKDPEKAFEIWKRLLQKRDTTDYELKDLVRQHLGHYYFDKGMNPRLDKKMREIHLQNAQVFLNQMVDSPYLSVMLKNSASTSLGYIQRELQALRQ